MSNSQWGIAVMMGLAAGLLFGANPGATLQSLIKSKQGIYQAGAFVVGVGALLAIDTASEKIALALAGITLAVVVYSHSSEIGNIFNALNAKKGS